MNKKEVKTLLVEANYNKKKFKNSLNSIMKVVRETTLTQFGTPLHSHTVYPPVDEVNSAFNESPSLVVQEDGNGYRLTYSDWKGGIHSFYIDYCIAEYMLMVLKLDYEVDRGNELRFYNPPKKRRNKGRK